MHFPSLFPRHMQWVSRIGPPPQTPTRTLSSLTPCSAVWPPRSALYILICNDSTSYTNLVSKGVDNCPESIIQTTQFYTMPKLHLWSITSFDSLFVREWVTGPKVPTDVQFFVITVMAAMTSVQSTNQLLRQPLPGSLRASGRCPSKMGRHAPPDSPSLLFPAVSCSSGAVKTPPGQF